MIFHLGFEIPKPDSKKLDHESPCFTDEEVAIIKRQIRRNAILVMRYIYRLDLFINKEKYPREETFIRKIRRSLELLMAENDTFRKVIWKHYQREETFKGLSGCV